MHMSRLKYFSVVAAPTIISLELRAPTTVRVLWTRPELSVTGYKVHDTLAVGIGSDGTQSVGLTGGQTYIIRASVDALCRDGTNEISRDPRTKRLQTRRESIARPSKYTNNNF